MKPSRQAQGAIDALVRAVEGKGDVRYFKAALEKYVLGLERSLVAAQVSQAYSAAVSAKRQRAARAGQENHEAHIAILTRKK